MKMKRFIESLFGKMVLTVAVFIVIWPLLDLAWAISKRLNRNIGMPGTCKVIRMPLFLPRLAPACPNLP